MTLDEYLIRNGISRAAFARAIGSHRSAVTMMCQGVIKPSLERAVRIELVTNGAVPPSVWINGELNGEKCE